MDAVGFESSDLGRDARVWKEERGLQSCSELSGGCEAECESPEGALFCDGQYIDHGGNLEECIASLKALFDIDVDVSAPVADERAAPDG